MNEKQNFYEEFHNAVEESMQEIKDSCKEPVFVKITGKEEIEQFVESLYADGKKPCERFGMSWEMLGELEIAEDAMKAEHTKHMQDSETLRKLIVEYVALLPEDTTITYGEIRERLGVNKDFLEDEGIILTGDKAVTVVRWLLLNDIIPQVFRPIEVNRALRTKRNNTRINSV
jgi:hypothetical protein